MEWAKPVLEFAGVLVAVGGAGAVVATCVRPVVVAAGLTARNVGQVPAMHAELRGHVVADVIAFERIDAALDRIERKQDLTRNDVAWLMRSHVEGAVGAPWDGKERRGQG